MRKYKCAENIEHFFYIFNYFYFVIFLSLILVVIYCFSSLSTSLKVSFLKIDVVYICFNSNDDKQRNEGIEQECNVYNNELFRYSLRSVLNNIPWINKIYVITSSERVKFLKNNEERKKKIIFIKDLDVLDFNSSSKSTLEHSLLHKLSNYNVSEYLIYMNDNCFINRSLKKKDFFYYSKKEKKIVPYVMKYRNWMYHHGHDYYNNYYYNNTKYLVEGNKNNYSTMDIDCMKKAGAFVLLYEYFNKTDIEVLLKEATSWNTAIPLTITDLNELHNMIKEKYVFYNDLFNSDKQNNKQITFDICYSFYFLNKYERLKGKLDEYCVNQNNMKKYRKSMSDLFYVTKEEYEGTELDTPLLINILNSFFYPPSKYENDIVKEGIYYIRSEKMKKLVWEMNTKNKMQEILVLNKFNGKDRQQFIISKNKENYYIIKNKYYNKILSASGNDIYNSYIFSTNTQKDKKSMEWLIFPYYNKNNSSYFYFRTINDKTYVDGCNYRFFSRHRYLIFQKYNGSPYQRFSLVKVK